MRFSVLQLCWLSASCAPRCVSGPLDASSGSKARISLPHPSLYNLSKLLPGASFGGKSVVLMHSGTAPFDTDGAPSHDCYRSPYDADAVSPPIYVVTTRSDARLV